MSDTLDWERLAQALRDLHRALADCARRDYERERGAALSPADLLHLLAADPYFAWLRELSELMVDIDLVRDSDTTVDIAGAIRPAVEHYVVPPSPPGSGGAFAQRYWPYLQHDPHVAMAHAEVKRAIAAWPRAKKADAASLLHERRRLAEKARHRVRHH